MTGLPDLRAWLAAHSSPDAELTLRRDEVKSLVDELGRLHQSADRLRRQNRKVRRKIERLKLDGDPDPGDAASPP